MEQIDASELSREGLIRHIRQINSAVLRVEDYADFGFTLTIAPIGKKPKPIRGADTIALWAYLNSRAAYFGYREEAKCIVAHIRGNGEPVFKQLFDDAARMRIERAARMSKAQLLKRLAEGEKCDVAQVSGTCCNFTLSFSPMRRGAQMIRCADEVAQWAQSHNKELTLEYSNEAILMHLKRRRDAKKQPKDTYSNGSNELEQAHSHLHS